MSDSEAPPPDRTPLPRWARRLVPDVYAADPGASRRLMRTFGIALAIRLVLMPFAAHSDLISTYHRAWTMLHEFRPAFWTPHQIVELPFVLLAAPFLRLSELLEWEGSMTASVEFWLESFVTHPQIFVALFWFKIPYLLCDLGTALVLLRLLSAVPAQGVKAVSLWLFNPITIFVFYVFGRHDAISLFFVALGLLALQRSRLDRSALAFGIALWSRYWPIFVLPFLVLQIGGNWRRKARFVAVALAPIALYNLASSLRPSRVDQPALYMFTESSFADYVLGMSLDVGISQRLFVFPAAYLVLLMVAAVMRAHPDPLRRTCELAVCVLAAFYATCFFHPQYFTWLMPFLVILRAGETRPVLRNLFWFQVLLYVPYTFYWKQTTAGFLFASLAPDFFISLPPPSDLIEPFYSALKLVNLARTGIGAACLFMIGWILLGERARTQEAHS